MRKVQSQPANLSTRTEVLKKIARATTGRQKFWLTFLASILVIAVASFIFYERYPYAFQHSSFYAEDGTIFARNIYVYGVFKALHTRFNGYLILGLYGLEDIGMLINHIFGNGFMTLAKYLALTSYIFLGFVCSLPWLLFRKKLGVPLALLTVLLLTMFPLGAGDYAVIGEIGNLKLAFFFVAALLVLYRNQVDLCKNKWQFIAIDVCLLICVLTNFLSLVTLPFALIRYKSELIWIWQKRRLPKLTLQHYSLIVLAAVSFIYFCAIYIKGIPTLPNYPLVVGPVHPHAVVPLMYRASVFGLLFPISEFPPLVTALAIFIFLAAVAWKARERSVMVLLFIFMVINYLGFLLSRPGVTTLFLSSSSSADAIMFFYAGTLIFIFAVAYGIRHWFHELAYLGKLAFVVCAIIYFALAVPKAGGRQVSYDFYKSLPTLNAEVISQCATEQSTLHLNVYPVAGQVVVLPRQFVCNYH